MVSPLLYRAISRLICYYIARAAAKEAARQTQTGGDGEDAEDEVAGDNSVDSGGQGARDDHGVGPFDEDEDEDDDEDDDDEDDDDESIPAVLSDVYLAKTISKCGCRAITYSQSADIFTVDRRATPSDLAEEIKVPNFEALLHKFLRYQLDLQPTDFIGLKSKLCVYTSAVAVYHAPSDICGIHGMARERIHATPRWGKFHVPRYDTVYAVTNPDLPGMAGLDIARVKLIFSVNYRDEAYPCALVHWYSKIDQEPDTLTGMWRVEPDFDCEGEPIYEVLHLDTLIRTAHLIGEPDGPLPADITYITALDKFDAFYVNKYVDHHAYEIAF